MLTIRLAQRLLGLLLVEGLMPNVLKINRADNVAVALMDLGPGTLLEFAQDDCDTVLYSIEPIPFGHKVALCEIPCGAEVIKYGAPIGLASAHILPGQHVDLHNLRSVRGAAKS